VFNVGSPGNGIGGYDLADPADRVFPFDYDHSGKLDHLVLYRPGQGACYILQNAGGTFSPVFANNPQPIACTLAGTATMSTSSTDARLSTLPSGAVSGVVEFSADRSNLRILDFKQVDVGPIPTEIGDIFATIARIPDERLGSFNAQSGALTLPVKIHITYNKQIPLFLGNSDADFGPPRTAPLSTGTVSSPGGLLRATGSPLNGRTGAITLVGASRFTGGPPLAGLDCTISIRGTFAPLP
jgi:hypothetical protein